MYHESDPLHGSVVPGSLPNTQNAFKGYKPLSITQRQPQDETMSAVSLGSLLATSSSSSSSSSSLSATSAQLTELPSQSATSKLHVFELLNEDVKLPAMETLHWCKVFEFQEFSQKQHLVKVSYFLFKFLTLLTYFVLAATRQTNDSFSWKVGWFPLTRCLSVSPYSLGSVERSLTLFSTGKPTKVAVYVHSFCHSFIVISFIFRFHFSVWILLATTFYGMAEKCLISR